MLQEMSLVDGGYDRCSLKVSLLFVSRKKSQDSYVQRNLTGASTHLRLPWLSNFIPSGKNISLLYIYIYICVYWWLLWLSVCFMSGMGTLLAEV